MHFKLLSSIMFIFLSTTLFANENNDTNVSKDAIFSLNKKVYEKKDFPNEYQALSPKEKSKFISQYIYYTLLSKQLQKESIIYKTKIEDAIKKRDADLKRKGIVLTEIEKLILDKKIVTDTIGYNIILEKHKNIDDEIKEFYEKTKKGFNLPKRVEISHIVIKDENLSKKLLKELSGPSDTLKLFSQYAKKYSLDRNTKFNGGYVGEVVNKKMPNEFFKFLWESKDNALLSKVLTKDKLFHIIYRFKKHEAGQQTLKEVRNDIEKYLLQKEIKKWERKIILELKKESKIVYY